MADNELLTIKEAARLMGVCENTLREWDESGKMKPIRTAGGHRRYSIKTIREYLDENIVFPEREELAYATSSFIPERNEEKTIDQLVKNVQNNQTSYTTEQIDQACWLTKEAWNRSKLVKYVNVQVMKAPCEIVYYLDKNRKMGEDSVAAITNRYPFSMFKNNFEILKEEYANVMAAQIDHVIFCELCKNANFSGESLLDLVGIHGNVLPFEFMAGPKKFIDKLRNNKKMDLIETITVLNPTGFTVMMTGGYKPKPLELPIFMPYILCILSPVTSIFTTDMLYRYAFYNGEK
jgi:excisionase family DNA binding protein